MDRRRFRPAAAVALAVLVASLVPVPAADEVVPRLLGVELDKWAHAAGYAALTVALARGYRARRARTVAVAVALATGYGAGVELLQALVPTRGASAADLLANAVGAAVAGLAWLAARRSKPD